MIRKDRDPWTKENDHQLLEVIADSGPRRWDALAKKMI